MGDYGMSEWLGPLISAAGNVGGGIIAGSNSSDGFSKKGANQAFWHQMLANPLLMDNNTKSVRDTAEKYKFSPLALLGQQPSYSPPVGVGDSGYGNGTDYGIGRAMEGLGQDISEHFARKDTPYQKEMRQLQLEKSRQEVNNMGLEGQLIQKQIDNTGKNPPMPGVIDDDGNVAPNGTVVVPKQLYKEGNPGVSAGSNPAQQWFTLGEGNDRYFIRGMSDTFADASEEDPVAKGQYWAAQARDQGKGIIKPPYKPPKHVKIPRGKMWKWTRGKGWRLVPHTEMLKPYHKKEPQIFWAPTFE